MLETFQLKAKLTVSVKKDHSEGHEDWMKVEDQFRTFIVPRESIQMKRCP